LREAKRKRGRVGNGMSNKPYLSPLLCSFQSYINFYFMYNK
jgi:hypothetical protein